MSVICKTFVQNTWRRDLCSNCFKSKEEHGGGGGGGGGFVGGGGGGGSVDLGLGEEEEDFSLEGVRPGSKRYVGVAGRVYQRGYYAQNSWKSLVIDKSDPSTPAATRPTSSASLMSPALIRGVASSLVTQENEKNRKLSDLDTPDLFGSDRLTRRLSSTLTTTATAAPTTPATAPPPRQSQAKILSQLLDDKEEVEERREEGKRSVDKDEFEKGDASSDLGSEASNDSVVSSASSPSSPSSTSSVASSSTCQVSCSAPNSDTASIKSEGKEEEEEEESKMQTIIVPPKSILRKTSSPKKTKRGKEGRRGVTFNSQLQELIGYGGDVDYGDDEEEGYQDEDDDDDDDEDFFEDLASLTPHERMLRRETMKNTEYNSDNKNLSKDIPEEEILPSVQELEEKRKLILAEIEALERLGRENKLRNEKVKEVVKEAVQEDATKQEARVKLKRSSPLVSTKPLIARSSSSEPRVNQVLPMKNGEVVRPGVTAPVAAPLIDAPPKYVSLEEEMVEKEIPLQERPDLVKNTHKVTSIDDVYEIKEKVTCLDDVCRPKKDASPSPPPSGSVTEPPAVPRPTTAPPARPAPPSKAPAVRSASEGGKAVTKDQAVKGSKGVERKSASPPLPSASPPTTTTITTTTPASTPSSTSTSTSTTVTTSTTNTSSTTITKPSTAITTTTSTTTTTPTKAPHPVSAPRKSLTNGTAKKEPVLRRTSTTTSTTTTTTTSTTTSTSTSSVTEKAVKKEDSPSVTAKSDASMASSHLESQAKESRVSQSESGAPSVCESPRLATQSSLESTKAPASRQSSTSSCMSTFGTPIMLPTTTTSSSTPPQQNTSFLHSSRGAYEDPYSCPANLVAPATPDFLREIKTPPEVPTPTAGISKSALYASTSCLKGLPGARPVITPKPPMLKEKPRVPLKPPPATRGIYATPAPVTPKVPISGLSGAVSTPNLASMGDSALSLAPKQTHPPVSHAFSTPVRKEAVYDIPVTLPPTTPTTTTSSTTSPTPTTTTQAKPPIEDTIYQEITDTLTTITTTATTTTTTTSPSNIQRHESARCQTRSTFEANRSLLSAALDFNSRANLARRPATTPAEDDEEDQGQPEEPEGATQALQDVQKDRESASSFTDDFDDDEEEEFGEERKREEIHQALPATTTTAATSSSSSSPFRNSIGPIVTHETQGPYQHSSRPQEVEEHPRGTSDDLETYQIPQTRPIASRSHSVPRAADHVVRRVNEVTGPLVTSAAPVSIIGGTVTSSSSASSRFFSRSGFFRPSSPPAGGKKDTASSFSSSSSERGGERTKKTSSSSSSSSSSSRQFLKRLLRLGGGKEEDKGREMKKEALKKGRPTIIHPLDYNGQGVEVIARPEKTMPLYDYSGIYGYVPPPQAGPRCPPEETYAIPAQARASPVPSSSSLSATSSISSDPPTSARGEGGGVVYDPAPLPTSLPAPSTTTTSTISTTSTTTTNSTSLEKRNSSVRKQESTSGAAEVERRESLLSHTSTTTSSTTSTNNSNNNSSSSSTHGLGYNSEGDVRAPITPRKPGRSSSIRGEDDREKRRAPQPPAIIQQAAQEAAQKASSRHQHQKQDSISSTGSGSTPRPVSKGPAPARPPPHPNTVAANTEAALEEDDDTGPKHHHYPQQQEQDKESAEDGGGGGGDQGTRTRRRTRRTNSDRRNPQEGGGRLSGGRAGPLAPRSLQAQYGAVMSANMDALANFLDQLSAETHPQGYEDLASTSATWGDITIDDRILVGAGQRLFYQGVLRGRDITLMLTSEAKIEAHHLLTPLPLVAFKEDHLPARLLSHRTIVRGNFSPGTVWVLPPMKLTTLRSRIKEEMREPGPGEWLQDACLLLLQLVTGLKQLQARGVEETSLDLAVVARDSRDPHPRLILVPPPPDACGGAMSLCQCAAAATLLLVGAQQPEQQAREGSCEVPPSIPSHHAFVCLLQLLHKERSVSLTQAKRVLEAMLFGPESFLAGEEEDEDEEEEDDEQVEATLERWLDLERATVLHSLTRGPPHSPILTKFHLLFLVSTSARVMREAVRLLAAARPQPPEVTSF